MLQDEELNVPDQRSSFPHGGAGWSGMEADRSDPALRAFLLLAAGLRRFPTRGVRCLAMAGCSMSLIKSGT